MKLPLRVLYLEDDVRDAALNREPVYFSDFGRDANFPRTCLAAAEGLRAACAFPIPLGGEVLGVTEFFSREIIDRIQIQQVLLNLLMNGIEALTGVDDGPRELIVSARKGTDISRGSAEGADLLATFDGRAPILLAATVRLEK
jgi:signal transduction histidine kinase